MFPGKQPVLTEENPKSGREAAGLVFIAGHAADDFCGDGVWADLLDILGEEADNWAYGMSVGEAETGERRRTVLEIVVPPFFTCGALVLLPFEASVSFELGALFGCHPHVGHVGEGASPPFGAAGDSTSRRGICRGEGIDIAGAQGWDCLWSRGRVCGRRHL